MDRTENIMENKTANEILSITFPEGLFSKPDKSQILTEYRDLAKIWHPDHNKQVNASSVFDHITKMKNLALEQSDTGFWRWGGLLQVIKKDGSQAKFHYLQESKTDFGYCFIGNHTVLYIINNKYTFIKEKILNPFAFKFASPRMETEMKKCLPRHKSNFQLKNNDFCSVVEMEPNVLSLKYILKKEKTLDPKHVAWIISTIYNVCCFFEYGGIVHHDISIDNYFVEPLQHFGVLTSNWYISKVGDKIKCLPNKTFSIMPLDVLGKKQAHFRTDLESVKALGRELLGDRMGTTLPYNKDIPLALSNWLRIASTGSAIQDYTTWQKVLSESFGAKRYVQMKLTGIDIYNNKEI